MNRAACLPLSSLPLHLPQLSGFRFSLGLLQPATVSMETVEHGLLPWEPEGILRGRPRPKCIGEGVCVKTACFCPPPPPPARFRILNVVPTYLPSDPADYMSLPYDQHKNTHAPRVYPFCIFSSRFPKKPLWASLHTCSPLFAPFLQAVFLFLLTAQDELLVVAAGMVLLQEMAPR